MALYLTLLMAAAVLVSGTQGILAEHCQPPKPISITIDKELNLNLKCPDVSTIPICPEPPKCPETPKCPEPPKCPECPKCPKMTTTSPTTPTPSTTPTAPPTTPVPLPDTCRDVTSNSPRPVVTLSSNITVVCDTVTGGGGWIVFQRRVNGDVDFYRGWDDYRNGFGDFGGSFWLGLEKMHQLTMDENFELRVDLKFKGKDYYAIYSNFQLSGEDENYRLNIGGYKGDAGDSLKYHNNRPFTTKDKDNDSYKINCAEQFHGAWWYGACHDSNLNGLWGSKEYAKGIDWQETTTDYDSATFTEMKIRQLV